LFNYVRKRGIKMLFLQRLENFLFMIIMLAGLFYAQSSNQKNAPDVCSKEAEDNGVCSNITEQMRIRLNERVKTYVEYHSKNEKDKLYDILFKPKFSREKIQPQWELVKISDYSFYISGKVKAKDTEVQTYFAHFCISEDNNGEAKNYTQYIYWAKNDWYFGTWLTGSYIEDINEPIPCKIKL